MNVFYKKDGDSKWYIAAKSQNQDIVTVNRQGRVWGLGSNKIWTTKGFSPTSGSIDAWDLKRYPTDVSEVLNKFSVLKFLG